MDDWQGFATKHACLVHMSWSMHQCLAPPWRSPASVGKLLHPLIPTNGALELRSLFSSELRLYHAFTVWAHLAWLPFQGALAKTMPVRIMPRTKSWTMCHTLNCHLQGPGLPPLHKTLGVKTMNVQVVWRSNALLSHPSLVAQWLEHLHGKWKVSGSIPGLGKPFA